MPYSVIARTNTGKSSQDDRAPNREQNASNLEFRVLRQSEATSVRADVAKISAIPPSNEADVLTLASLTVTMRFLNRSLEPTSCLTIRLRRIT